MRDRGWSARWSGTLTSDVSGPHEISVTATDGVRLSLDGKRVINAWQGASKQTRTVQVDLKEGEPHALVLEGRHQTPGAQVRLCWARPLKGQDKAIAEAVRIAKQADAAVVFVGGSGLTSGEIRDADNLELTGRQMELLQAVYRTKTPIIVVHIGGRPNTMEWVFDHAPAVLTAWNAGEEGGNAVADVLFGDFNPCGKLPAQWPVSTGQLPSTYDYMHTGRGERGGYMQVAETVAPRYPFGYGLSYTRFAYGNLRVPEKVTSGSRVTVTVDVQNIGEREGIEVAQLYVHDVIASVKRPMRQLKGFKRVSLKPGETKTVEFTLTPAHLAFWNAAGKRVVEPGEFRVMAGGSAQTAVEASFWIEE
jgi:beta-glucosidase